MDDTRSHSFRVFFTAITVLSAGLLLDSLRFVALAWRERTTASLEISLPFFGEGTFRGQEELQSLVFLFAPLNLACLIAIATALAILLRGRRKADSDSLAIFLALSVFFVVGPQSAMAPQLLGRPTLVLQTLRISDHARLMAVFHTAWFASLGLALVALLRFSVFFPKTLSSADIRAWYDREEVRDSMRWIERALLLPARLVIEILSRVTPFLPRDERSQALSRVKRVMRGGERDIQARQKLLGHIVSGRLWVAVLVAPSIAVAMALIGARASWVFAVVLAFNALSYFLLMDVIEFMRASYHVAEGPDERRKLLWVVEGLLSAFWVFLLCGAPTFATWRGEFVMAGFGMAVLVFVLCLAIAVFHAGAVDPSLAIRKTTVYGVVGVLFFSLLAGVGNLVEGWIQSSIGLPGGFGTVLSGGGIAVVLIPVKRRMDGYMIRILPVTALAQGPTSQATVIFSDIVGYTRLTGEDQANALTLMSVFHKAADRVARENSGRTVKTVADEVLLEFKEPRKAVQAARELRGEFHEAACKLDLATPELSTGIHSGVVVRSHDGDLFGDTVNIASRLEGIAEPGQIVVSQAVADQLDIDLEDLGGRSLKNVPEPVRCWAVKT